MTINTTLKKLNKQNPSLNIRSIMYPPFKKYGQRHNQITADNFIKKAQKTVKIPKDNVVYRPSVPELEEERNFYNKLSEAIYGGMNIQIGYCCGYNKKLNGLEYHKGSEVIVALNDIVLFLGWLPDIDFGDEISYDSSLIQAFFVEAGSVVELYGTTLHLAPCHVKSGEGFKTVIVLPYGTNLPVDYERFNYGETRLLAAKNKWLITHPDLGSGYQGIIGENLELTIINT